MDGLQFEKAEFSQSSHKCSGCTSELAGSFFSLAGKPICPACAESVRAAQVPPPGSAVLRGALWGFGAAVVCAIAYAVLTTVTGASFALAAIAVGYVVGRAVRLGSRGFGGRRCQALAVVWTYLAICAGYVPSLTSALEKTDQRLNSKELSPRDQRLAEMREKAGPTMHRVLQDIVVIVVSLTAPLIGLATGIGGIIGAFIVFIGLRQAWKLTGRDRRVLAGPYTLGEVPTIA